VKLLTLNLLHGGFLPWFREDRARTAARLEMLAVALGELAPDVIAVQEALVAAGPGAVADQLAARLGMTARFVIANPAIIPPPVSDRIRPALRERINAAIARALDFSEGLAVLTALPVLDHRGHALPRPRFPLENRMALRVRIAGARGPLDVWNAHLTRAGGGHRRQTAALAALVLAESSDVPAVVLGDFNVDDAADGVRAFAAAGFRDTYRSLHPHEPGLTAWQRIDAARATVSRRVDYCWLAPHTTLRVVASDIVLDHPGRGPRGEVLWPSDHYGLLTEIAA
jgi:endonuclease/exonuclease/phosphatase family metal-dependent hydrolase